MRTQLIPTQTQRKTPSRKKEKRKKERLLPQPTKRANRVRSRTENRTVTNRTVTNRTVTKNHPTPNRRRMTRKRRSLAIPNRKKTPMQSQRRNHRTQKTIPIKRENLVKNRASRHPESHSPESPNLPRLPQENRRRGSLRMASHRRGNSRQRARISKMLKILRNNPLKKMTLRRRSRKKRPDVKNWNVPSSKWIARSKN